MFSTLTSGGAWIEDAKGAAAIAQIIAIVVGGFWAYSKLIRGRTYAQRLEPSVSGALIEGDGCRAIVATATLSNTGLSAVRFLRDGVVIYVYRVGTSNWMSDRNVEWGDHVRVTRIFEGNLSIEAEESLVDEVLIPIPDFEDRDLTYRLEFVVMSRTRWRSGGSWNATSIVPGAMSGTAAASSNGEQSTRSRREVKDGVED